MEYNYKYGQQITKEIKKGKSIHDELESEVNVPIILQPKSYSDALYKSVYTSFMAIKALKENKKTREIQLYGSIGGYKVVGKMDQLEIKNDEVVILEDKTRQSDKIPSEAQQLVQKIQVMMYKKLMDDLREGLYGFENFRAGYHTNELKLSEEFKRQLSTMDVSSQLQDLTAIAQKYFESIKSVGKTSDTLQIRYINQFTGKEIKLYKFQYSSEEMSDIIKYALKYWNGTRKAAVVPESESWKCNWCVFYGKECKEYWHDSQKVL